MQLTQNAARHLKQIKDRVRRDHPECSLRLVTEGVGQFRLGIARAVEREDRELRYAGDCVLVVDPHTDALLSRVTLDFEEAPEGGRLVLVETGAP